MTYWKKYIDIPPGENSPIQLDGIVCDGHLESKTVAVITHFHQDHIEDIEKMLTKYDKILMTHTTFQVLIALKPALKLRQQFVPTNYGTAFRAKDSTITLFNSNHIPGSCSVLVEHDGKRMLYSGDFNYPNIHIPRCDYLVLDATHGDPKYDYTVDRKNVLQTMAKTVYEKIQNKEQVVITASRGTLQEIIQYFETISEKKIPNDVCFISTTKEIRILEALYEEEYRTSIRHILERESIEANKIIRENKPCIYFTSNRYPDNDFKKKFGVLINAYQYWEEDIGIIHIPNGMRCNLSTHANYENILKFIRDVNPHFVLTDASRSKCAEILAERIKKDLHIDAVASKHEYP